MSQPKQIGRVFAVETEEGTLLHIVLNAPKTHNALFLLAAPNSQDAFNLEEFVTTLIPFADGTAQPSSGHYASETATLQAIQYASNGGVGHG